MSVKIVIATISDIRSEIDRLERELKTAKGSERTRLNYAIGNQLFLLHKELVEKHGY